MRGSACVSSLPRYQEWSHQVVHHLVEWLSRNTRPHVDGCTAEWRWGCWGGEGGPSEHHPGLGLGLGGCGGAGGGGGGGAGTRGRGLRRDWLAGNGARCHGSGVLADLLHQVPHEVWRKTWLPRSRLSCRGVDTRTVRVHLHHHHGNSLVTDPDDPGAGRARLLIGRGCLFLTGLL